MSFLAQVIILVKKDLKIEFKQKEGLTLGLGLALLLSALVAMSLQNLFISKATETVLLPALFWIIFLFSATITAARTYEHDYTEQAIYSLLVLKVFPSAIFLSKVLINFLSGLLVFVVGSLSLLLFLGQTLPNFSWIFLLIVVLTVLGFASLAALCEPLTRKSTLKNLLFPLIFLPLMFPVFLTGIELSIVTLNNEVFNWNSPLLSLLILCCLMYLLLGLKLIDYVFYE